MSNYIGEIEEAFAALRRVTGTSVVWKTTRPFLPNEELDHEYRSHRCGFCCKVKALGGSYEKSCIANDFRLINRRVFEERKPFKHECHAGGSELAVPFFNRDRYIGVVLCGPFRREDSRCTYPETERQFTALPLLTPELETAYVRLLTIVAAHLLPKLEKLEEQIYYSSDKDAVSDERILAAIRYMELNFKRKIGREKLAAIAALSESRFSHLFRSETGLNYREYLLRIRLQEACRLLRGTELTILEIAQQVGIDSQSRLAAMLKRRFQMTPLEYRRSYSIRHLV